MNTESLDKEMEAVCQIVADEIGIQRELVAPESNIEVDFHPDSLTVIEIMMAIEAHFDISITDEEAEKIVTVRDLYDLVISALAARR